MVDNPQTRPLPDVAADHGERIEVWATTGGERLLRTATGGLLALAGLVIAGRALVGLADELLAGLAIGTVLVAAGLAAVAAATRRLEVDRSGFTQKGLFGSRTVAPPDVSELELDEHAGRTSGTFARRLGGVRIGLGGQRATSRVLGMRRSRWTVSLVVRSRSERDLAIGLGDTSLDEARSLVAALRERARLPDHLPVAVHSDR